MPAKLAKEEELKAKYNKVYEELEEFFDTELEGHYKCVPDNATTPSKELNSEEILKADPAFHRENWFLPLSIWLPLLYALLHRVVLQPSSKLLSASFLVPVLTILYVSATADLYLSRLTKGRNFLERYGYCSVPSDPETDPQVSKAAYTVKVAAARLTRYKKEWQIAKDEMAKAYKEETELRLQVVTAKEQACQVYVDARKSVNLMRHRYYTSRHRQEQMLIDALDKLIEKFKNVSVPKVKGVTPKKTQSNSLTGPLERLANALKADQDNTEKQLKLTAKITEVLEAESDMPVDFDKILKGAEWALNDGDVRALHVPGVDGDGSTASALREKFEAKLDEHYDRLDAYYKGFAKKSATKEMGEAK
jgi:hypothetical protein